MTHNFDNNKLAELIVYFSRNSENDNYFGSTKLNKLLFLADFWAYAYLGKSITGTKYVHEKHGPAPSSTQFLPVRKKLIDNGRLEINEKVTYRGIMKRPATQDYPDLKSFTREEIQIMEDSLNHFSKMDNTACEEWSHDLVGYKYTKMREEIPYDSIFFWRGAVPNIDDEIWANKTARELGLI